MPARPTCGFLAPDQGLARVYAAPGGVITAVMAREGQQVRKGQPLVALSTEQHSRTLGGTQAGIARTLALRRDSLADEARQNRLLLAQQSAALERRLAALASEEIALTEEIALQASRVALAHKSEARQSELRQMGFISDQQLQAGAEARLDQGARLRGLRRALGELARERATLDGELRDLPLRLQVQAGAIERNRAAIEHELAQAEALREVVVPAPQSGVVTSVQAEVGGGVNASVPLLTIVPAGGKLEAHLYAPSRAIGFVRPGQRVLLRYQAYPYQKFGHHPGAVTSVSRTALSPAELPPQAAAVANAAAGAGPGSEPVYRIVVALAHQHVTVSGQPVALQSGMQLDADIVLERRRLVDWLLAPLYSFTGKLAA